VEEWAGEVRVNLIRLVAIALFYGHHLLNYHVLKLPLTPDFHLAATGVAAAWTAAALALHAGLQPRWNPPWLKFATVAFDALMLTSLLVLTDGARSPLVAVLFLLVATAPLRLRRSLVWAATVLALLSFLFVCGHDRWVRGLPAEQRLPRPQQVITGIALACAGVLAGQSVRQARRFARDYADRVRPEEAA
jgi:hypothetical protein